MAAAVTTALVVPPNDLHAQTYASRPVRLIVPQAPGSASDTVTRIIATELTRQLGQQLVGDNRPGGALTIGIDTVVKAPPERHRRTRRYSKGHRRKAQCRNQQGARLRKPSRSGAKID